MNEKDHRAITKGLFYCPVFLLLFLILTTVCPAETPRIDPGSEKVIRSACEIDYPPFSFVDANGQATGFAVELLRQALKKMGREVTFQAGTWPEVRGLLERGEVKALPLVGRTPERIPLLDFTFPYMTLHGAIVVRRGTTKVHGLDDLKGKSVAVMKGDNAEEFLRRQDRGLDIHVTDTFTQALTALSRGHHDAVVIQRLVALRLIRKTGLVNLTVLDNPISGFVQDFCFAVTEGDRETLALLNEGLALVIADGTYRQLHARWFAAMELPDRRSLVIGGDQNFPPYEFLDKNGRPAGYNVDLTRAIAGAMDLDVEIRLGPWTKIRQALARGEIDAVQGMFYSLERDFSYEFTAPHIVNPCVSVVRKGQGEPPSTPAQLADRHIVVQQGDIMHDFALKNKLQDQLTVLKTQEEALQAVAHGKYDCALVSRVVALYLIDKNGWDNLAVGRQPLLSPEYGYAVPNNRKALLAQLTEGLRVVDETGEYHRIYEKWIGAYMDYPGSIFSALRRSAVVLVPLVLIMALFLLWSWSLRRQVAARTRELKESADKFKNIFESANVAKSITLPDGRVSVNQAFADFLGYTRDELTGKTWQELTPADEIEKSQQQIDLLISGREKACRFQKKYLTRDGRQVWADVSVTIQHDANGAPLYFITTVVDINEQKNAERNLLEIKRILDATGSMGKIGGWEHDLTTGKAVWTRALYDIIEIPYDQSPPGVDEHLDFYPPEYREMLHSAYTAAVENGTAFDLELQVHTSQKRLIWCRARGEPVRENGRCVAMRGTFQDITERKESETALENSETRYRTLTEVTQDVIWTMNLDLEFTYVNSAIKSTFGYTVDEWVGSYLQDHCDNENFQMMAGIVEQEIQKGPDVSGALFEAEMIKKNGDTIPVEIHGQMLFDPSGRPESLQGVTRDISERRAVEAAIRSSEKRLRAVLDASPFPIVLVDDNDDVIQYWSQSAQQLFGHTASAASEWYYLAYPDPDYRQQVLAQWKPCLEIARQSGRPLNTGEYRVTCRDGSVRLCEIYATFIDDGLIVSFHDITEKKKAQEKQAELQTQLNQAQKIESIGRLAGGVAHDFNNMLTIILGHTEMGLAQLDKSHPLFEDLTEIQNAAGRSAELTQQLLAFARKQTIAPEVLSLNKVVDEQIKMLRRLIGENIGLTWLPGQNLFDVQMDPSQINQILINLSINSREAISGTGNITIRTGNARFDETDYADHGEFFPGDYVMLGVTDDGHGMDKDVLDDMFEPFFTTKNTTASTGLGLSTVYGIVKQNNGFIRVDSEPEKGTTFKIYFPAYKDKSRQASQTSPATSAGHGSETILVVEDEESILRLARRMLEKQGYQVLRRLRPVRPLTLPASTPARSIC